MLTTCAVQPLYSPLPPASRRRRGRAQAEEVLYGQQLELDKSGQLPALHAHTIRQRQLVRELRQLSGTRAFGAVRAGRGVKDEEQAGTIGDGCEGRASQMRRVLFTLGYIDAENVLMLKGRAASCIEVRIAAWKQEGGQQW